MGSGSYIKGCHDHGHGLDPPGGNTGLYHQCLEILTTTGEGIFMGIMALKIGKIWKNSPPGEWTMSNMDRVNQGFLLMKICITNLMNIDHLPQTQEETL